MRQWPPTKLKETTTEYKLTLSEEEFVLLSTPGGRWKTP